MCEVFVAPMIGETTGFFASSQASATWTRSTPRSAAILATCSTMARSVSSVESYFDFAVWSVRARSVSASQSRVRRPAASGLYGVEATPSSRSSGIISRSSSR